MQDEVVSLKHRFLAGHAGPAEIVAPAIMRSWRRCNELQLSPDMRVEADPVGPAHLRDAQERSARLIADAAADMSTLDRLIGGSSSMLILTDTRGLILDTRGDPDIVTRAQRVALQPGGDWDETVKGTNAIGTALRERRAVEVHGGEHFFDALSFLNCACAPIFDPFGEVVGALDVTTHREARHPHTMGLVALTVELIEQQMFKGRFPRDMVVEFNTSAMAIGAPGSAVMVLREDGVVTAMNRHAFAAFDAQPHHLGRIRLADLVATPLSALRAQIMSGDGQPVTLEGLGGRHFFARASASYARLRGMSGARAAPEPASIADPDNAKNRLMLADLDHGDPVLGRAIGQLRRIAGRDIPIVIEGETGTGKELLARAIHNEGRRAREPFVAINCAAIPEHLIEAELFGHVAGAFTGAARGGALGRIRQADGGTLFLDEIGDMPPHLQTRLLRVLQERVVVPVGGTREIPIDIAVISATHRDIFSDFDSGFRADLLHRLAGFRVALPPLRERQDFEALVARILAAEAGDGQRLTLTLEARAALRAHDWPGNIRELKNVLRTASALADETGTIGLDLLPAQIARSGRPADGLSAFEAAKQDAARQALAAAGGNYSTAARALGISRTTLYKYVERSKPVAIEASTATPREDGDVGA
jgi:transcriptional regulator of acetoin/glycerol metabolism